jgi:hypothetical protein
MRFIPRSTTLKARQSKIVPGAVSKLRDSRVSFGRVASPNNKITRPAALPSSDNDATEEPSRTSEDSGLLLKLILAAVGAIKFSGMVFSVTMVSTTIKFSGMVFSVTMVSTTTILNSAASSILTNLSSVILHLSNVYRLVLF